MKISKIFAVLSFIIAFVLLLIYWVFDNSVVGVIGYSVLALGNVVCLFVFLKRKT